MNNVNLSSLSRRRFIAAAGLGAATAGFAPRLFFAQETGIVPTMINEAARAKGSWKSRNEPKKGSSTVESRIKKFKISKRYFKLG